MKRQRIIERNVGDNRSDEYEEFDITVERKS